MVGDQLRVPFGLPGGPAEVRGGASSLVCCFLSGALCCSSGCWSVLVAWVAVCWDAGALLVGPWHRCTPLCSLFGFAFGSAASFVINCCMLRSLSLRLRGSHRFRFISSSRFLS